jgi:CheY-like chemotaxis protein
MMTHMMGGSISVESEYGKGSVFTVRLPQKVISAAPIGLELVNNISNFHYSATGRKQDMWLARTWVPYARVLVVDDVPINFDVAKGMMKPYGIQVDYADSGQKAINIIRDAKVKYNTVFMDHMMPELDGIQTTKIIREEIGTEYAKTIPIIALTANAIVGNEEMFLNNGFQAYLPKPIELLRLDTIINQWVRDKKLEKSFAMRQINLQGETFPDNRTGLERRAGSERRQHKGDMRLKWQEISGLDTVKGIERFSGDKETYMQVLQSFAINTPAFLDAAKEVNEGNLSNYAIIVHGIKGSCRGICADIAGDQAEALEKAAKTGDLDFVKKNNPALIRTISKLVADIDEAIGGVTVTEDKPKKDRPDKEALLKLLEACENYKIADIEEIMKEIESFEYKSDDELVYWLRTNVVEMNYSLIVEKLKL